MDFWHMLCCCCCGDNASLRPIRSRVLDWRLHPVIQQYLLVQHIGEGGFSEIWLAQHKVTGDKVAIKVVYLSREGLSKAEAAVLESEAKYLTLLEHPRIIHCKHVLETKHDLVLVLEYLSGGELLDHLHTVSHLDEPQAAQLFRQVVEAVAYLHGLNIMHRDIKPENVMFTKKVQWFQSRGQAPQVKLIDLGMAAVYRRDAQNPKGCLGSPGFIAPEIVQGGEHGPAMDIYALGSLLYVLLTGRKVWDLKDIKTLQYARSHLKDAPGLKDEGFLACSQSARDLVVRMMADKPQDRPTAEEVLAHAWTRGQAAVGNRPLLDPVVRNRMMQLANLRKYKGLAFALMMNAGVDATVGSIDRNSLPSEQSLHELAACEISSSLTNSRTSTPRPVHADKTALHEQGHQNPSSVHGSSHHHVSQRHQHVHDSGYKLIAHKHRCAEGSTSDLEASRHNHRIHHARGRHGGSGESSDWSNTSFSCHPWYASPPARGRHASPQLHGAPSRMDSTQNQSSRLRQHSPLSTCSVPVSGTPGAHHGSMQSPAQPGRDHHPRAPGHRRSVSASEEQHDHKLMRHPSPAGCTSESRRVSPSVSGRSQQQQLEGDSEAEQRSDSSNSVLRRAPDALLTAIRLQRKLMHQEMKSRARIRARLQQEAAAGGAPAVAARPQAGPSMFATLARALSQAVRGSGGGLEIPGLPEAEDCPLLAPTPGSTQPHLQPQHSGADISVRAGIQAAAHCATAHRATAAQPAHAQHRGGQTLDRQLSAGSDQPLLTPHRAKDKGRDQGGKTDHVISGNLGNAENTGVECGPDEATPLLARNPVCVMSDVALSSRPLDTGEHGQCGGPETISKAAGQVAGAEAMDVGAAQPDSSQWHIRVPGEGQEDESVRAAAATQAPVHEPGAEQQGREATAAGPHLGRENTLGQSGATDGALIDVNLVATALLAAPQLTRSWTAPDPGAVPNVLSNAIGTAPPRNRHWDLGEEVLRAATLNPLTLAYLEMQTALQEVLGEQATEAALRSPPSQHVAAQRVAGGCLHDKRGDSEHSDSGRRSPRQYRHTPTSDLSSPCRTQSPFQSASAYQAWDVGDMCDSPATTTGQSPQRMEGNPLAGDAANEEEMSSQELSNPYLRFLSSREATLAPLELPDDLRASCTLRPMMATNPLANLSCAGTVSTSSALSPRSDHDGSASDLRGTGIRSRQ